MKKNLLKLMFIVSFLVNVCYANNHQDENGKTPSTSSKEVYLNKQGRMVYNIDLALVEAASCDYLPKNYV